MQRELNIVRFIFLTYLIFGITQYFSTAAFVTPIHYIKPILIFLALLFYILNFKKVNHFIAIYSIIAWCSYAFTDEFIIGLLSIKFKLFSPSFFENTITIVSTFILFWSFIMVFIIYSCKQFSNKFLWFYLIGLYVLSTLLLVFTNHYWAQETTIKVLFLSHVIAILNNKLTLDRTAYIIAYQYLALILLEMFEYFV